jgi:hypothetical protein
MIFRTIKRKRFDHKADCKNNLRKLRLLDQLKDQVRKDVEIISIQLNLELVVYWKVLRIGKGPVVTLRAYGNEVLKFDCFRKDDGHYHVAPIF